jgi:hypothetical protein
VSVPPPDYPDFPEADYPPLGAGFPEYPPPGYSPSGFGPPPNYLPAGHGPPGYASSGYGPPPGYGGPPPGYGGPPPGYAPPSSYGGPPQLVPRTSKPGIIPLRPLGLNDIFNGAVAYIRANPKTTLGLAAVVAVIAQTITLIANAGPLAAASRPRTTPPAELTGGDLSAWTLSAALGGLVSWLATVLLVGMLAVVVGRAVFGSRITIGETWAIVRRRVLALIGLVALEGAGLILLSSLVALILAAIDASGSALAALVIGFPLVLASIAALVYLYTVLSFAPVLIVLERLSVMDAITRSFELVRNSFWRVLGIRMLTAVVVFLVAGAIAMPFNVIAQLLAASHTGPLLVAITVGSVGSAIGRVITAPFSAGVVVLLYTDRRIRAEAFDLVLPTGAAADPAATASIDYLWLTRPM